MTMAALVGPGRADPWGRFFVAYVQGDGAGHVQSLILGAVLFNAAVVLVALGIIGDLLCGQRMMTQRIFERVRRIELQLDVAAVALRAGRRPDRRRPPPPAPDAPGRPGKTEEREALQL